MAQVFKQSVKFQNRKHPYRFLVKSSQLLSQKLVSGNRTNKLMAQTTVRAA